MRILINANTLGVLVFFGRITFVELNTEVVK